MRRSLLLISLLLLLSAQTFAGVEDIPRVMTVGTIITGVEDIPRVMCIGANI